MAKKVTSDSRTPEEREAAIKLAVDDVLLRQKSYREAERDRRVPKSTIADRVQGALTRQLAHADQQALYPAEEAKVVDFCDEMQRRFLPLRLAHVVGCAEMILSNRLGLDAHLGKNWATRFVHRHPELKLTTSKRIDERRVMAKNPENVMGFYVLLSQTMQKYNIHPSKIFNMDEKGYLLSVTGKEKVVILTRDHRDGYAGGSKDYGNRETITTIDCICADGTVLPPMVIMKGKYVLLTWNEECPELNAKWACSPNGWTDNELGVEYIKQFDIWTADKASNDSWRCLILDGHGSHLTYEFLDYALKARILVLGLPSHSTDFLQPLDRVIFRVLQRCYSQAVQDQIRKMLTVTKNNFGRLLHTARQRAYTTENILSAFEATGISPFDPYRTPLMRDFRSRAQRAHLPSPAKPLQTTQGLRDYANRQDIAAVCREVAKDESATAEELRSALIDALSAFDGSEAQVVILKSELLQLRAAQQARQTKKPRGGRVGQARAYTQAEIEEIRKTKEARDLVKTTRASKKKERVMDAEHDNT